MNEVNDSGAAGIDREQLRAAVRHEYAEVAENPNQGFHFHTGRTLAKILEYPEEQIDRLPPAVVESLAGTGNPFAMGALREGEHVIDIGCGAGFDSFIAAEMVGSTGAVVGIDMTPEMLGRARAAAAGSDLDHLRFEEAFAEALPVPDGWADVIISNGALNLCPDKDDVFAEMYRKLTPGGRLQIGDILVTREVPEGAKSDIDLWTG
ncbi:MAG: methyltransferase domain-containing protein [Acidobacteriota bacterium]|nr:methyltransferase domain-containing protein [Acidobacteriota bacterium]